MVAYHHDFPPALLTDRVQLDAPGRFIEVWLRQSFRLLKAAFLNRHRVLTTVAIAALLWGVYADGHALALGDLHGAIMIGRSLDVTVSVMPGPDDDLSTSCLSADVYYAETRQSAPRLSLTLPPDPLKQTARIRVQQPDIVNEPVVTLLLRTTCGAVNTRRYVMLADVPALLQLDKTPPLQDSVTDNTSYAQHHSASRASASAALSMPPAVVVLPVQQASYPDTFTSAATHAPQTKSASSRVRTTPKSAAPATSSKPTASSAASLQHPAQSRPTGKSLLRVDPLDLMSDRIDALGSVMQFAPTEDALLHGRQIVGLQADLKAMRDLVAKNDAKHEAQIRTLQTQLQQAEHKQAPSWLVYSLIGLVLVCLGTVVWMVRQQRGHRLAWWHDGVDSMLLAPTEIDIRRSDQANDPAANLPTELDYLQDALQEDAQPPFAPVATEQVASSSRPMTSRASSPVSPRATSNTVPIHRVCIESVLDLRQQAEFFVSLGQTDRASGILKQQISDNIEPHPLVYLDLLSIYHSLGLRSEFEALRGHLEQDFRVRVSDFADFAKEGLSLEDYPETLSEISLHWPSVDAVVFLDACIYADAPTDIVQTFDLAAFRDLLTLHMLAEDVVADLPASITVHPAAQGMYGVTPGPTPVKTPPRGVSPLPDSSADVQLPVALRSPPGVLPPSMPIDLPSMLLSFSTEPLFDPQPPHGLDGLHDAPLFLPDITTSANQTSTPLPSLEPSLASLPTGLEDATPQLPPDTESPTITSPPRMLDLDFSTLGMPPAETALPADNTDSTPPNKTPTRYATRSRWPVIKKPN